MAFGIAQEGAHRAVGALFNHQIESKRVIQRRDISTPLSPVFCERYGRCERRDFHALRLSPMPDDFGAARVELAAKLALPIRQLERNGIAFNLHGGETSRDFCLPTVARLPDKQSPAHLGTK